MDSSDSPASVSTSDSGHRSECRPNVEVLAPPSAWQLSTPCAVVRQPLPRAASSSGRATSLSSPAAIQPGAPARPATISPLAVSFPFVSSVPPGLQNARSARTRVRDPPDFAGAIVADEKRAISEHEHTDRTSPYVAAALVSHPAGDEVIVAAGRAPVVERNADDFVSSPPSSLPG